MQSKLFELELFKVELLRCFATIALNLLQFAQ
jgi:hypothetical protein